MQKRRGPDKRPGTRQRAPKGSSTANEKRRADARPEEIIIYPPVPVQGVEQPPPTPSFIPLAGANQPQTDLSSSIMPTQQASWLPGPPAVNDVPSAISMPSIPIIPTAPTRPKAPVATLLLPPIPSTTGRTFDQSTFPASSFETGFSSGDLVVRPSMETTSFTPSHSSQWDHPSSASTVCDAQLRSLAFVF